jgi:hypothetical protein
MSLHQNTQDQRVKYNPLTATYDTPDGTKVAQELVDNAKYFADFLHVANVREKQRNSKERKPLTDDAPKIRGISADAIFTDEASHFIKGDA